MGSVITAPINEATNFLSRVAPAQLAQLRRSFLKSPTISSRAPGQETKSTTMTKEGRFYLHVVASCWWLSASREECATLPFRRLLHDFGEEVEFVFVGQIVETIASSGVLGALGATETTLAAVSGVLALLASIATLGADYVERIVDPSRGNLSAIYLELTEARVPSKCLI